MFSDIIHLISPHRKGSLELELERKSQEQERLLESRNPEVSRRVSAEGNLKNEFQAKLRLKEAEQKLSSQN